MRSIPMADIRPPKIQLRPVRKSSVEYYELLDSVRMDGILQPILVRPKGEHYEVVEGNWRYHAAKDAGLSDMPCLVKAYTDDQMKVVQLKANAIRPQTQMAEYALRLNELMDSQDLSLGELARLVNKGAPWVRKILSLRRLCLEARKMVDRGEISVTKAAILATLPRTMQDNFLPFAVVETIPKFREMIRLALSEFRQCCQRDRTAWSEYRAAHAVAYLRQMNEIEEEVQSRRAAGHTLKRVEAKTPMDGWRACLAWLLHLDPESLAYQEAEKENYGSKSLKFEARRKSNRMLLKELRSNLEKSDDN